MLKKAIILAAGRGKRLKPLTNLTPKPLIRVGSDALIERNLLKLQSAGIEEVVINVCYRARQIIDRISHGDRYSLKITFSYESPRPLGTGGGIFQALNILGRTEPFLVLSGDIWTDFSFEELSLSANKMAHLVLVEHSIFYPKGDYDLLSNGLVDLKGQTKYPYANIAVLHSSLFGDCDASGRAFSLAPLLNKAVKNQKVSGELYSGRWFNVGTLDELEHLRKLVDFNGASLL